MSNVLTVEVYLFSFSNFFSPPFSLNYFLFFWLFFFSFCTPSLSLFFLFNSFWLIYFFPLFFANSFFSYIFLFSFFSYFQSFVASFYRLAFSKSVFRAMCQDFCFVFCLFRFFSFSLLFCFPFFSLVQVLSSDLTLRMGCHICRLFGVEFLFLVFLFFGQGTTVFWCFKVEFLLVRLSLFFRSFPCLSLPLSHLGNTDACSSFLSFLAASLILQRPHVLWILAFYETQFENHAMWTWTGHGAKSKHVTLLWRHQIDVCNKMDHVEY